MNLPQITIPEGIAYALQEVQRVDPKALVAGGCLRDLMLGAPVKDIDIFVTGTFDPDRMSLGVFDTLIEDRGVTMMSTYGSGGDHRGPMEAWTWFTNVYITGMTWPVQIIRRTFDGPYDLMADMDFGFCQVSWDGKDLKVTRAFLEDVANNTATFTGPDGIDRLERAHRRADRLKLKYPTREFVIPPFYHSIEETF